MKTIKMKDSGIEWIGEIPEDWKVVYLSSIFNERKRKNRGMISNNLLSLSYGEIKRKDINTSDGLLPESFEGYNLIDKGDIVLRLTDLQNDKKSLRTGIAREKGIVTSAYVTIHCMINLSCPDYMHYYLHSFETLKGFYGMGDGVRQGLSFDGIKKVEMLLPALYIQQKIANFLDVKCAEIDKLIANQQGQIDKLKEYKQSVITEAVTKGLDPTVPMKDSGVEWIGQIPQGWVMTRIKNTCTLNPTQNKCDSSIDIVSYLPMECVKNGYIINREIDVKSVPTGLRWFIEKDIIMAKVTPCFENGNIAIAQGLTNKIGCGSSELFVFRPKEVVGKFLLYLLQNRIFTEHAKSTMNGTGGLKRVSPSFVKNFPFALPSTETQQQIAGYLDDKCGKIDQLIAIKQQKIDKLQQYKKSLIYEYVTGKKEVV